MGYQGGRFSGIAFTSERWLAGQAGYRQSSRHPLGHAEPSATIVHGALADLGAEHDVVLWNAVPAHPFAATPLSNRAPTRAECDAGLPFLDALIDLLRPATIVAVGRTAERMLGGRASAAVRHPSQGGATAFRRGLSVLLADRE